MPLGKKQVFCNCGVIYKLRRDSPKSLFKGQQRDTKDKSTSDLHGPHGSSSSQPFLGVVFCLPRMPCYALACFPPQHSFYFVRFFFFKEFWPSCKTCTQGKHVRRGFPQFSGFHIAACFGVITACLGVNAACFPGRPKNWFLRGANTCKLVWFRWWGLKVICSNWLAHVHEIEYTCMWAVKWVASNPKWLTEMLPSPICKVNKQNISNQRLCGFQSRQHFINCGVF